MTAIAYAAHTDAGTFLLDEEGICRAFVPSPDQSGSFRVRPEAADRCVGAQYVASIDMTEPGGLVPLPRVGAALLLGVVEANGRIALVRTGPLVRFENVEKKEKLTDAVAAAAPEPVASASATPKSEIQLDVVWDDESTAVAPSSASRPTAANNKAPSSSAPPSPPSPPSDPFHYELDKTPLPDTDEPTTLRFRPSQLSRAAKPKDAPSGPFSDEPPTPANATVRRAVALGSAERLVGPDDTIERNIAAESSGRRG